MSLFSGSDRLSIVPSALRVTWPGWTFGSIVLTRLFYVVRSCLGEETSIRDMKRANEVL